MRRSLIASTTAIAAAACLALTACGGGGNPLANGGSGAAPSGSASSPTIVVGSANFTENQPSFLVALLVSGLRFPLAAAAMGATRLGQFWG